MIITDLINNETIVPVTQGDRKSLPPSWQIYEVLKWGDWYVGPVNPSDGSARDPRMVFVVVVSISSVWAYVPMSLQAIKHAPDVAKKIVEEAILKELY